MKLIKTEIKDLMIIEPKVFNDKRGLFKEIFNNKIFQNDLNINLEILQDNISISGQNVARGLHYQVNPNAQSKLVSVTYGRIIDFAVDIRRNSPTYAKFLSVELSSDNHRLLYIPKGFAHGYITLSKEAIVNYKVDNYYDVNSERTISFFDKYLNIDYKRYCSEIILSEKDKNAREYNW